jgi:hypothetical protein
LEDFGGGAAGAEAGGDGGERRHHDHGDRCHGGQLPERRARDPVFAQAVGEGFPMGYTPGR